jgi:hypothetical protein
MTAAELHLVAGAIATPTKENDPVTAWVFITI